MRISKEVIALYRYECVVQLHEKQHTRQNIMHWPIEMVAYMLESALYFSSIVGVSTNVWRMLESVSSSRFRNSSIAFSTTLCAKCFTSSEYVAENRRVWMFCGSWLHSIKHPQLRKRIQSAFRIFSRAQIQAQMR